jgi:hypothetical protein
MMEVVNAVFLLRDGPWELTDIQAELSRCDLAVEEGGRDRLVVASTEASRVFVGIAPELDLGLRNAFGAVDLPMLLEVEYSSLALLFRVLEVIDHLGPALADNDHGFHGTLEELLRMKAEQPDWDWRVREQD